MAKMDLKTAYNKIDNLCCVNNNVLNRMHTEAEQGFNIPTEDFDFFKAYKDTHGDEDFCKDANEMIDALETIRKAVEFQEGLQALVKEASNKESKKLKKVSDCTVAELERYYGNKTGCTPDYIAIYWYDVRFMRLSENRNEDKVEFYLMKSDEIEV